MEQPLSYQQEALKTKSDKYLFSPTQSNCDMLHAAIGIATEGGELLDALKKAMFYGKPLDVVNLKEELGDVMWYIAIACQALGTTIDEVQAIKIAKLKARFPNKFTSQDAIERDLDNERRVLEGQAPHAA